MAAARLDTLTYYRADALAGRVALITGGASGIGFEIARQFGLHGAKVVIMGRREKFLQESTALLQKDGIPADFVQGDVRRPEQCAAAVKKTVDTFGALDILVNSAAGNFLAVSERLSPNGFKTVQEIDTQGVFNMMSSAFEPLKASKFGGVVTNLSAALHYTATWYQVAPVAAKAAIDAMTRNLAMEWGEYGIRCNCVAPGAIQGTPGVEKLSGGTSEAMSWSHVPLQRPGTRAEIASAVLFQCLNEYVTGHITVVDGGSWFQTQPFLPRDMVERISRGVEKGSRDMGPGAAVPNSKL